MNHDEETTMNETIGGRLKRVREEKGMTQRELACEGVSHAHISRIEKGAREASVRALRLLAARLGVSAAYLETGHDESAGVRLLLNVLDVPTIEELDRLVQRGRECETVGV
jgi:transcriptional regulator with XRE-family HTH domain